MSLLFSRVLLLAAVGCLCIAGASPAQANSKYAAFVIHADSGDVLFDRYSTAKRYPASLTKMMTLYLLFEELEAGRLTLQSKLKVSKTAAGQPPSKLGLKAGSTITVEDAIKALSVKSANDVAVVVAEKIAGTEWRFAQKMTSKARKMGMRRTTFRNASGLPNSRMVTTARDMATLAQRVSQDFPQYFQYFSEKSFTWNGRTYRTHNSLVRNFDGATGLKTGYTRRSGFNLATTVDRNGDRLIGIVLGGRSSSTRDRHMRDILTKGYARLKSNPNLVAALHRNKPSPRMKPTLLANLETQPAPRIKPTTFVAQLDAAPTLSDSDALRQEIAVAASGLSRDGAPNTTPIDSIGALIAAADSDDLNEIQIARIASLSPNDDGMVGQGDFETGRENWSIQIGAYTTKALAQKELETAAFSGGLMERRRTVLPTQLLDGAVVYRARFSQLTEIEAVAACETLKTKEQNCFVVSDAGMIIQ